MRLNFVFHRHSGDIAAIGLEASLLYYPEKVVGVPTKYRRLILDVV